MRIQRWFLIIISTLCFWWGLGLSSLPQRGVQAQSTLTQLVAPNSLTVELGQATNLPVRLAAMDRALAQQTVHLIFPNGAEQTAQTDQTGLAHFQLPTRHLAVGQHGLRLVFPGTTALRPAISIITIQVQPPTALTARPSRAPEPTPKLVKQALSPSSLAPITTQEPASVSPPTTAPWLYLSLLPAALMLLLTVGSFTGFTRKGQRLQQPDAQPGGVRGELFTQQSYQTENRLRQVLIRHLWASKGSLAVAGLAMLGTTAMDLLGPWPLKIIFDHILLKQPLPENLSFLNTWSAARLEWLLIISAGAMALIAGLGAAFSYVETYVTSRVGFQLVTTLRRELFAHLQRLPLSFYQQTQRGEVLTKVASDTQTLRDLFTESGLTLLTNGLTILGMTVVMLVVNWQLALIPLLIMPLIWLICVRIQSKVTLSTRSQRKQEGKITAQLAENLAIMPVVQAFGREQYEVKRFNDTNNQNLIEGIQVARLSAAMTRTITVISALCLASVVSYGGWLALQGQMTPGEVLLFITYLKGMYKPLREVVKLSSKLTRSMISAQRIAEILNIEPEVQDKPNALVVPQLSGEIRFQNVSFGYSAEHPILQDLSFEVPAGRRVAIVGSSGAGKSTILNLLLRLYDPQQGSIQVDGVDLCNYQRESYRSQLGLVLQDSLLFGASIRENIAYGRPQATLAEIETAARQAHIHDFIISLPQGYATVISELGSTLSGGQRQRIAIARALVKQPSILLMDEPTSALDVEARTMVEQTMKHIAKGKTMLVITHQLSTIQDFDEILVMQKGRIVERGTHRELLRRNGFYAQLQRLQSDTPSPLPSLPIGQRLPALQTT